MKKLFHFLFRANIQIVDNSAKHTYYGRFNNPL
jgi:hypothetical protein